ASRVLCGHHTTKSRAVASEPVVKLSLVFHVFLFSAFSGHRLLSTFLRPKNNCLQAGQVPPLKTANGPAPSPPRHAREAAVSLTFFISSRRRECFSPLYDPSSQPPAVS